jgi:acyl-CoA dehydrogenase
VGVEAELKDAGRSRHHSIAIVRRERVALVTPLTMFGYDDAPFGHASVTLDGVRAESFLGERGDGLVMAQARLGPGRVHHCMRAIGLGERCLELMVRRAASRRTFGRWLLGHGTVQHGVAQSRIDIDASRLLVLHAARLLEEDPAMSAGTRGVIAAIKVFVPSAMLRVIDRAIQVHGAEGVRGDGVLAKAFAGMRCLRIADGPDEVHERTLAGLEAVRVLGREVARERLSSSARSSKL